MSDEVFAVLAALVVACLCLVGALVTVIHDRDQALQAGYECVAVLEGHAARTDVQLLTMDSLVAIYRGPYYPPTKLEGAVPE